MRRASPYLGLHRSHSLSAMAASRLLPPRQRRRREGDLPLSAISTLRQSLNLSLLLIFTMYSTAVSAASSSTSSSTASTTSSPQGPPSATTTSLSPTVFPSLPSTVSMAPTTFPGAQGPAGPAAPGVPAAVATSLVPMIGSQQMTTSSGGGSGSGGAATGSVGGPGMHVQLSGTLQGGSAVISTTPQQFNSLIPQLAALAGRINVSRIVSPTVQLSSPGSGTSVLRFTILDGTTSTQNAYNYLHSLLSTISVVLSITETGSTLALTQNVIGWTDTGPCPTLTCNSPNGGICDASLSTGVLACACAPNYQGPQCYDYTGSNPLLGLIVIPIVVAIVLIALGVYFYVRWRRAERERKKAPPADTPIALSTTDGSRFGTVSEPGVRNMVYPTISNKSYAIAFSDGVFNSAAETEGGLEADKRATAMF